MSKWEQGLYFNWFLLLSVARFVSSPFIIVSAFVKNNLSVSNLNRLPNPIYVFKQWNHELLAVAANEVWHTMLNG